MFSSRLHWDLRPNRIARALDERRRAKALILDLTESNPTRAGIDYPPDALRAFEDPGLLIYDPAPAGSRAAREAVSAYYAARGRRVEPERILLTASTSEAYAYLFKLLADAGDNVLVPRPSYPLFEFLANLESIEVRQYPLVYHGGWSIDMDALAAAISARTRAVVVVNPNNPTGSYVKRGELEALARLCAERDIAILSDEVFHDYALPAGAPDRKKLGRNSPRAGLAGESACPTAANTGLPEVAQAVSPAFRDCFTASDRAAAPAGAEDCLAFSMSGLSKIAGLPQMKLGWIVASGPAVLRAQALERLEWIADTYLSVGTPVQCAAPRLLAAGQDVQRRIMERTTANLAHARAALAGAAAGILAVEGGWYITVQVPRIRSEEEWVLELLARDVLVQPGFFYDFESEAYLVLSLLTPPAVFQEGVERLKRLTDGE